MVQIPPPQPKRKRTPNGVLFLFARVARFAPRTLLGCESDEHSSLGEEPKTIAYRFWRTKSPKQGARRARPVLRRRATMRRDGAMFALALGTAAGMCLQYLSVPIPPPPPAHSPCHFVTSPSPSPEGVYKCCRQRDRNRCRSQNPGSRHGFCFFSCLSHGVK